MTEKQKLISVSQFARLVGVDESTVRGHIDAGRFTYGVTFDEKGRRKIVQELALQEWAAFGGGSKRHLRRKAEDTGDEPEAPISTPKPATAGNPGNDELPTIDASTRKAEFYKAQSAELKYLREVGELVNREDVYKELFETGVELRKAVLAVPDLVVDNVMAAKSRVEAHAYILDALEDALTKFTDAVGKSEPDA